MTNIPKIWVWVIIVENWKVLLWLRKWAHWEWTWAPPGWHLEFMETFDQCWVREVKEETDLDVNNLEYIWMTQDFFHEESKHYITIFMKSEWYLWELKNLEPHKCETWKWFEIDNLPNNLMLSLENLLS